MMRKVFNPSVLKGSIGAIIVVFIVVVIIVVAVFRITYWHGPQEVSDRNTQRIKRVNSDTAAKQTNK